MGAITSLALLLPSLSAGWRRLHDTGRSGWWIGGGILGIVGFLVFILMVSAITGFDDGGSFVGNGVAGILLIVYFICIAAYAITMLVFLFYNN